MVRTPSILMTFMTQEMTYDYPWLFGASIFVLGLGWPGLPGLAYHVVASLISEAASRKIGDSAVAAAQVLASPSFPRSCSASYVIRLPFFSCFFCARLGVCFPLVVKPVKEHNSV